MQFWSTVPTWARLITVGAPYAQAGNAGQDTVLSRSTTGSTSTALWARQAAGWASRGMGQAGARMYCGQWQLEKQIDIAGRDSERGHYVLPDHYGGLPAVGAVLTSLEWPFSWSWHHGLRIKRAGAGISSVSAITFGDTRNF